MRFAPLLLVGCGGFLGALARYGVGSAVAQRLGAGWPYGTFLINITGCFAIGFFVTLSSERLIVREGWRLLVPVGFIGAYTTFSTYEYETLKLVEAGAWPRALGYVALSTLVGFAAVWLASWAARQL